MNLRISHGQAIRSVLGCSRVTHFTVSCLLSGWLATEHLGALLDRIQAVEQRPSDLEHALVVEGHREAPDQHVDTRGFGGVETLVRQVGLVDDPADLDESRVAELMHAQKGLKAAVALVMRESDTRHVEGPGVGRNFVKIVDEDELAARIDEAADEPGAARSIDVAGTPRRPSHETASSESPSSSTAARARLAIGSG